MCVSITLVELALIAGRLAQWRTNSSASQRHHARDEAHTMKRLGLETAIVDEHVYGRAVRRARDVGAVLPTFAQLARR